MIGRFVFALFLGLFFGEWKGGAVAALAFIGYVYVGGVC